MNKYELMVMLNPDMGGDATKKRLDGVRKLIASQKGEVVFEDDWGLRDLAYKIGKHDRGYYYVANFNLDPQEGDLKEIDTTLRLENEVTRHMIVKIPSDIETKTFSQFEAEAAEEKAAWEAEKEKSETKKAVKRVTAKKEAARPTETPKGKEEQVEEVKKASKVKEDEVKEPSLEDVDAKLKSIIDNPDLNF